MVNNYLKIAIDGKEVGLKFGFAQVKEFAIAMANNLTVYFDGDTISPIGIAKLIHTAHRNDCLLKEVEPSITFEQISNWIDTAAGDEKKTKVLTDVVMKWQESEYTKSWIDNVKKKTVELTKELKKLEQSKRSKPNTSNTKSRSGAKGSARKKS
jgi:hypothetical protein